MPVATVVTTAIYYIKATGGHNGCMEQLQL
jgi:hypothetical protein